MARRVIALMGCPIISEERVSNEVIIPGHLLNISSGKWIKNTAAADDIVRTFALERDELGKDIDDAYASGETVKAGTFKAGERVYAFLASGQSVADGAHLTSDNAGLLTAAGVADGVRLGRALEAVNATLGPPAGTRIRVELT